MSDGKTFCYNPEQSKSRTGMQKLLKEVQQSAKNNRIKGTPLKIVVLHGIKFVPFLMHRPRLAQGPGSELSPYLEFNMGNGTQCGKADEIAEWLWRKYF